MKFYNSFIFLLLGIFLAMACAKDQLPDTNSSLSCADETVTFDNQIQPLIETYCAIPDCHDSGSALGDYTAYTTMVGILNESGFKNRVIDTPAGEATKMPPPYTVGPIEIAAGDLELIQCWINQNYPEN